MHRPSSASFQQSSASTPFRINDRRSRRAADAALDAAAVTPDPIEARALEQLAGRLLSIAAGVQRRPIWSRR